MRLLKLFVWFSTLFASVISYNITKFSTNQPSVIAKEYKQFIIDVITKYGSVKHGCVVLLINDIPVEYGDYISSAVSALNSTGYILNFYQNKDAILDIGEKHVKIAVVDPNGELNHIYHIFGKIKLARAKIIVMCTEKPNRMLFNIILATYRTLMCLNAVIVYPHLGKIHVYTVNPFLTDDISVIEISSVDNLFYSKMDNLMGYELNALFTFEDRTKANSKYTKNGRIYMGKDYETIFTIFKHMNASLNMIHVQHILNENETNPWVNSNKHVQRLAIKNRIINDYNISIVLHSQPFLRDDGITENTYPHTQDDDCIMVLKGTELPLYYQLLIVFSKSALLFNGCVCIGIVTSAVIIRSGIRKTMYTIGYIITETVRILFLNNFSKYPKLTIHNLVLFGLIHYCFYLNVFFQSQFASVLTKKSYYKDIDTIQELYESQQEIYAFVNQIDEIKKIYGTTNYSDITNRFRPFPDFTDLWELNRDAVYKISVSTHTLRAFVTNYDRALFVSRSRVYRENGRAVLHLMRESIIPSYQCYQLKHGSPFLPNVNRLLRYLQEGGILDYWSRRSVYQAMIEGLLVPYEDYEEVTFSPRILDLKRSAPAFFVLLLGHSVAYVVFVIEVLCKILERCRSVHIQPFIN